MSNSPTIIRTKLNRPRLNSELILRQRLLDRFEQAVNRPASLVSAPAGYGKTTAVNLWLETVPRPFAWLSLDEHDSRLLEFVTYLVAALRTAYPEAGRRTLAVLAGLGHMQPEALAGLYLKDLEDLGGPLVIVLDDYHVIHDLEVHAFVTRVVQQMPAGIHLVVISRVDPPIGLARLRGRGRLAEYRGSDLRFTRDEAAELGKRILRKQVADEIVDRLGERTEGWPVGFRLACIAMREGKDPADFVMRFAQSSHRTIMDYLLAEVLEELGDGQYMLLLRSSILDRFCAPLCGVLEERAIQGESQRLIDLAWQSNLFLVALDAEGKWYRYHHIFRDLLRLQLARRVSADVITDLHRRASVWFEEADLLEEAIIYAVRANDVDRAARLVESNINDILNREDWPLLEHLLGLLPKAAHRRPALLLTQAYLQHFRFNVGSIDKLLDACVAGLAANECNYSAEEIAQLRGQVHQLRASLFLKRSPEERLHHASLALQTLTPEAQFARSQAELFYGVTLHELGRTEEGLEFLAAGLREESIQSEVRAVRMVLGMLAIHNSNADLISIKTTSESLIQMAQPQKRRLSGGWAYVTLGWVYYQQNELDLAMQIFSEGIDERYAVNSRATVDRYTGLALTQQAQGRSEAAIQTAAELRKFLAEFGLFNLTEVAEALDLRLALGRENHAASMRQWQAPASFVIEPEAQLAADTIIIPVLVAVQAHVANGTRESLAIAWSLLQRCRSRSENTNSRRQLIAIGMLEALTHAAQGNEEAALSALGESIRLAEPGGALRLIVDGGPRLAPMLRTLLAQNVAPDFTRRLLGAFGQQAPQPAFRADFPSDLLTERELDVLNLLAKRMTDKEIGHTLYISPRTVQKHTRNIYQKLHVNNRRQAVKAASAAGIPLATLGQ